jgi:hypothetical protein
MQPQDDPEARIRELERPLADVARTSELGVEHYSSGHANTPVPPPAYYGGPYAPAPRNATAGVRWWYVFALCMVVLVAIGAGVAVFSANVFTDVRSAIDPPGSNPGISGGGGSVDSGPGSEPSAPGAATKEPTAGESVTIPPPGGQVSVSGVGKNETIDCNDAIVSVSGVSNTVTITGHCVSVTVSGMENQVTLDTADIISASGFDNRVTFHSGSPKIDATDANVVEQG